jgi:hypothetical protein
MAKLTFSLDDESVRLLRQAAARSRKPQSLIVREAIVLYSSREDALAPEERDRLLAVLRRIKQRPPTRSRSAVEGELREIRRSRRTGWSRRVR